MKTKNVKVRAKDVKHGVTIYTAHPVYGIDSYVVLGKPYINKHTHSLFVKVLVRSSIGNHSYQTTKSLCDEGITSTYNDRRSFFKLKHAEEWMRKWKDDKGFQKRQKEHEESCRLLHCFDYFYEEFEFEEEEY